MEKKKIARITVALIFSIILLFSFKVKLFQMIGSDKAFTLSNFTAPVALMFLPSYLVIPILILGKILKGYSLFSFLFILPSLVAAYVYKNFDKKHVGVITPLIAMLLFLINPVVGFGKSLYFALWLIPIFFSYYGKGELSRSIVSTFNAHSVGSILFLYFIDPMNPLMWNLLIPVVIVERSVFSVGISTTYFVFKNLEIATEKALNSIEHLNLLKVKI